MTDSGQSSSKQLGIIRDVHFGVGDRGRVALWFTTMVDESGGALQVFEDPDVFLKIIADYGVEDVAKLAGQPCWVNASAGLIRWVGAWKR
jgi:hypothetical protein